jgi:hypothetical protein
MSDERIREAVRQTTILRSPKQSLATFGTTNIHYYLLTEPTYNDLIEDTNETVIREGRVIAQRPKVVTPYYLAQLEGFSAEAKRYFQMLIGKHGHSVAGLFYSYRNEPKELSIVSDDLSKVADRINAEIEKREEPLTSIIKGQDDLWDVSLMRFIYEITGSSVQNNLRQMGARGLLNIDSSGIPADARVRIEELFRMAYAGQRDPRELKDELDHWGLFEDYQDRFLRLFGKR